MNRRRLLKASSVILASFIAGCTGDDESAPPTRPPNTRPPTTAYTSSSYKTAQRTQPRTAQETQTTQQTESQAVQNAIYKGDEIYLLDLTYTKQNNELRATIYNPSEYNQTYYIRLGALTEEGYTVSYEDVESDGTHGSGEIREYRTTFPNHVKPEIAYQFTSYSTGSDWNVMHTIPSNPPNPPKPWTSEPVSNPGQFASGSVDSFTTDDYGTTRATATVENLHSETIWVDPTLTLKSDGGRHSRLRYRPHLSHPARSDGDDLH